MPTKSRSTVTLLVFGSVLGFSILGYFLYSFWTRKLSFNKIINKDKKKVKEDILEELDDKEEEDTDESNETSVDEEDFVEYKAKYDDTIRLAKKLLSGNAYLRAAETFKEAIKLAEHVPSASKDLVTLYNNSSAMYEKAGVYDEALLDINIVLHMDNQHIKARLRRARIFDVQGKHLAALQDYVMVMLLEQAKGDPSGGAVNAAALDRLAKILASKETNKLFAKMKLNNVNLGSASKSFNKQFFESFPNYYIWPMKYAHHDRETLAAATLSDENSEESNSETRLTHMLDLICFDIYHKRFAKAHDLLVADKIKQLVESAAASVDMSDSNSISSKESRKSISLYYDLLGSFYQLSCRLGDAAAAYITALEFNSDNLDARLKLIVLYIEFGEMSKAETAYDEWLQQLTQSATTAQSASLEATAAADTTVESPPAAAAVVRDSTAVLTEAWILTHRAGLWTMRGSEGAYMPEAINLAITDITRVRSLTDDYENEPIPELRNALKGARYVALMKAQYVVSHTAGQMAVTVSEAHQEFVKDCTEQVATLFPNSDNSRLQAIESVMAAGQTEEALAMATEGVNEAKGNGDSSLECTYYITAANIVTQKAFEMLSDYSGGDGTANFQSTILEAVELYEKAMAAEPSSSEAIAPYAQLKVFTGDFKNGVAMVENGLKLVRTRDEAQDLYQLFFMTQAQALAVDEMRANQLQTS